MIDLKAIKQEAEKYPEPLRSIMEMQKDSMTESDFSEFMVNLLRKAREMDRKEAKQ